MNPYASYLGGQDAITVLRETPSALQSLVAGLSPQQLDTPPAPGKWSIREILAHLADCEIAFGFRLRQALADPVIVIQPFDQDLWARRYGAYSAAAALRTFLTNREWTLSLLTTVTDSDLSQTVVHPERGTLPFRTLLETIAGHDRNHLTRLEEQLR